MDDLSRCERHGSEHCKTCKQDKGMDMKMCIPDQNSNPLPLDHHNFDTSSNSRVAPVVVGIEIISDLVCPWCFVGKRLLDMAIKQLDPTKVVIKIKWTPYLLHQDLPSEAIPKHEYYTKKFGAERTEKMKKTLRAVAREIGINFDFDGRIGNTLQGHRLMEFAKEQNLQHELVEEIFHRFFEKSEDISDFNVLCNISDTVGLRGGREFLGSDALYDEVFEHLKPRGIQGVPHFIVNNRYQLGGAQPAEQFLKVFKYLKLPFRE